MILRYKNKNVEITDIKTVSWFGVIKGLMFTSINTKNLLFRFKNETKIAIHSFFVFYPFLAIWLDRNNNVIEYRVIRPFSFSVGPHRPFCKLIEIPLNKNNRRAFGFLVAGQKGL